MKEITAAIAKVMSTVGYVQKKGENKFHGYKFAAIGDLLAKIQPAMAEAGLVIMQSEVGHELMDSGNVMTATYEFALAHTSGESWSDKPRHTGMAVARNSKGGFDDKALNKCHTAARKYFLMGLFQIPTGDVADPDEDDHAPPPTNGNGIHSPLPVPAKRPVAAPPTDEAKKWADKATVAVKAFETQSGLTAWEQRQRPALDRLKAIEPDIYTEVEHVIAEQYAKLIAVQP